MSNQPDRQQQASGHPPVSASGIPHELSIPTQHYDQQNQQQQQSLQSQYQGYPSQSDVMHPGAIPEGVMPQGYTPQGMQPQHVINQGVETHTPEIQPQVAQENVTQQAVFTPPQYATQDTNPQHSVSQAPSSDFTDAASEKAAAVAAAAKEKISSGIKKIGDKFKAPTEKDGLNLGFTPTAAMVKSHEQTATIDRPLYQFQVTKLRSWRTGYVRLLSLYHDKFCTFDPDSHQVTNTWSYPSISEWMAMPKEKDNILLQVGTDKLKFKCHHVDRAMVMSKLLECKVHFEKDDGPEWPIFRDCLRQTRHGTRTAMSFRICPHGLQEIHPSSLAVIQTYHFTEIDAVSFTADDQCGIVFHFANKSRLFYIQSSRRHGNGRSDLLTVIRDHYERLGIELNIRESCSASSWLEMRRQLGSNQTIVMTWDVNKITRRHDSAVVGSQQGWIGGSVNRKLALTSTGYLLELDGGGIVSQRPLKDLRALVRHPNSDKISLEFAEGCRKAYESSHRDALLVSIMDAAQSLAQNKTMNLTDISSAGYTLSDVGLPEESSGIFQPISIPLYCLKRLYQLSTSAYAFLSHNSESSTRSGQPLIVAEECSAVIECSREFNASIPPSGDGLPEKPNDKQVLGCIGALWGILSKLLSRKGGNSTETHLGEASAIPILQALYRLCQTPAGFKGTVDLSTMQECIKYLWDMNDDFCQFWSLRVLLILLNSKSHPRDREVEYVNKSVILQTGGSDLVKGLVSTILDAGEKRADGNQVVSDLILMVTSDILQSILCSNHDTTNPAFFDAFIEALGKGHRALLSSLRCQTPFVIENTALLLHLLSSHAPATASEIRDAALSSGILLQHFHAAIFSPLEGQRFLSRYLCSLWLSGSLDCDEKRLLKRMVPSGFFGYLKMPMLSRVEEEQLDEIERDGIEAVGSRMRKDKDENELQPEESTIMSTTNDIETPTGAAGTNTSRLRERIAIADGKAAALPQHSTPENFRIFFHVLTQDHSLPDLIWNQQTRRELRIALENEIQMIKREIDTLGGLDFIAWNHQQFLVPYPSLDDEVRVGNVYMRLWLQAGDGFIKSWGEPCRLFELLFRRFLCELDRNTQVTIMCIRCLERLYMFHADQIGPFLDIMILIRSMASTKSVETQHRLLALLATLLGVSSDQEVYQQINIPDNAEQLLNNESIGQLCQFVAWCHTNGIQVGNLLSATLKMTENKSKLITDGSDFGPGGDANSRYRSDASTPKASIDQECPALWFVASTGRTPPPIEKIKGPYRVSELQALMETGDLQPFDQVTASQVDNYDEDQTEGQLKDTQIDTGKWRRLEQVSA